MTSGARVSGPVPPTTDDPVVRALSEGVGGPVGTRAGRHRWWTPVRVLLALTAVCFALGMVQKSSCYQDDWHDGRARYSQMCYSDLPYLYTGRGLAELNWPYTSDPQVRARRRTLEARARGEEADETLVLADILKRDERDRNRAAAPLKAAEDAHILDNSNLDIEGGVRAAIAIVEAVRARR